MRLCHCEMCMYGSDACVSMVLVQLKTVLVWQLWRVIWRWCKTRGKEEMLLYVTKVKQDSQAALQAQSTGLKFSQKTKSFTSSYCSSKMVRRCWKIKYRILIIKVEFKLLDWKDGSLFKFLKCVRMVNYTFWISCQNTWLESEGFEGVALWDDLKISILVLKPRADVNTSTKQRYQRPRNKDKCPANFLKNKINWKKKGWRSDKALWWIGVGIAWRFKYCVVTINWSVKTVYCCTGKNPHRSVKHSLLLHREKSSPIC